MLLVSVLLYLKLTQVFLNMHCNLQHNIPSAALSYAAPITTIWCAGYHKGKTEATLTHFPEARNTVVMH